MISLKKLKEDDIVEYNLIRASLLQKLIRRSMIGEAVFVAKLFLDAGHEKGLRRRLAQIAVEDIGLVCPRLIEFVKQEPDLLKITATIASIPKNREVDRFLLSVAYHPEKYNKAKMQTKKEVDILKLLIEVSGKWFDNKKNKKYLDDLKAIVNSLKTYCEYKDTIDIALNNYLELSRANTHGARVFLSFIALLTTRKVEDNPLKILENYPLVEFDEVFDFAIDMHTITGKRSGRSFSHWIQEGAFVSPEKDYPDLFDSSGNEKYPLLPLLEFLENRK